ncbi:hypothetical protein ACFLSE_07125 [Bacteroidota bacterium]
MRKIVLITLFVILISNTYSQNYDLIVNTNGDSIACHIDSVSDAHIYFKMKYKRDWINTNYIKGKVVNYQYDAINKKNIHLKSGSSYIVPFNQIPPNEKMNLSFFLGFSSLGPKSDIENAMKSAG